MQLCFIKEPIGPHIWNSSHFIDITEWDKKSVAKYIIFNRRTKSKVNLYANGMWIIYCSLYYAPTENSKIAMKPNFVFISSSLSKQIWSSTATKGLRGLLFKVFSEPPKIFEAQKGIIGAQKRAQKSIMWFKSPHRGSQNFFQCKDEPAKSLGLRSSKRVHCSSPKMFGLNYFQTKSGGTLGLKN